MTPDPKAISYTYRTFHDPDSLRHAKNLAKSMYESFTRTPPDHTLTAGYTNQVLAPVSLWLEIQRLEGRPVEVPA